MCTFQASCYPYDLKEAVEKHQDKAGGFRKLFAIAAGYTIASKERHYEERGRILSKCMKVIGGFILLLWSIIYVVGVARPDGSYDFFASGDHGQFIYVSPQKHMVIVRNGLDYGIPYEQWLKLFYDFASKY